MALASAQMDFSKPDPADEDLLNQAIWFGTRDSMCRIQAMGGCSGPLK
jgi:hypothetical protein